MITADNLSLDLTINPKELKGHMDVNIDLLKSITGSASGDFDITFNYYSFSGNANGAKLFGIDAFGMKNFGFKLSDEDITLSGDFSLTNIHQDWNFGLCHPSVDISAGIQFNAGLNYKPFSFKGIGTLYGTASGDVCGFDGVLSINLNAQVMFPNPTCVSAGISIFGLDFSAGFNNGVLFFGDCF